ncbi:MAG: hypothetical protein KBS96_08785 [Lachnospiraceae bacterium]|nr:hypothetical protein [Candidatus Colinaster scatohippi]
MELASKSYNLSMNELLVLLAMKNARQLYGVFDKDFELPDEAEVNRIIFNLVKRGIVEIDEHARMRDDIGDLIENIRDAGMLLIATSADESIRDMAFYIGKKNTFLRFTGVETERVRIEEAADSELSRILFESEWMIENNTSDMVVGDGLIKDSELCKDLFERGKNELCEVQGVKASLILMDIADGKKMAHLLLVQDILSDYIVVDDGLDRSVFQFSDRQFNEMVSNIIKKGKEKIKK